MEDRQERFDAIKRIIKSNKIESQEDLLKHLEKEGFEVTQATLSRDLKSLKVVKALDNTGGYFYTFLESENHTASVESYVKDFQRGFISIDFSGNFAVIKTLPGHANSVAFALDNLQIQEILGTIAGDDTILVIPHDGIARTDLVKSLKTRIGSVPL
ncbi:MAG: arginine repressor [Spirochaetales bacterium]|nr:arginine repressor [Spirochaetales bacterium]